jgi:hypothetical protein
MNYIPISLFFIAILLLSARCSPKVVVEKGSDKIIKVYKLSGQITYTRSYCGGIAPKPDMVEKQNTPQPYSNRTLFIKQASDNLYQQPLFHSFTTDSNGKFSLELPQGDYAILDEAKIKTYDNDYATGKGKENCDKWLNTPTLKWKISQSDNQMNSKIHIPCLPCQYPAK